MTTKKISSIVVTLVSIAVIITGIILYSKYSITIELKEITDINDPICVDQIKNKSIFDLKYEIKGPTEEGVYSQTLGVKNNTGKEKIYTMFNVHVPQKLIDNKIVSSEYDSTAYGKIYNLDRVPYVKGATVYHGYSITESELTESQENILKELKDTLYCEMYIDKYLFYLKLSNNNYEIISLDEFKENAAPFENGMLINNMSKNLTDYKFLHVKKK